MSIDSAHLESMLGYLNFAEGRGDARFQKNLNDLYAQFDQAGEAAPWKNIRTTLEVELHKLATSGKAAFKEPVQAQSVLGLVFEHVIPAYRKHHADLLFHLTDADLQQPFFMARVFEAVLNQRGPWDETKRIVDGTLKQLNDYVGHRPIAVLEGRRGEPYDHERCRPIPLFIRAPASPTAGTAIVIAGPGELLEADRRPHCSAKAYFDLTCSTSSPSTRAPTTSTTPPINGPTTASANGIRTISTTQARFRRFIVRQITLDGLWQTHR